MDAWFVSDIHLKNVNERNGIILLRFLFSLLQKERPATHLFLLGDIFDLWIADHQYFAQKFSEIVQCIEKLVRNGVKVIYIEGNHDLHMKKFWKEIGVELYVDPIYLDIYGKVFRLEHGDQINLEDIAYRRYRAVVRHPTLETIAYSLPGGFWKWFGEKWSHESRKHSYKSRLSQQEHLRGLIRSHAFRSYENKPFDFIISGHMHVRDEFIFNMSDKEVKSFNLGSWFDEAKVLYISEKNEEWVELFP